MRGGLRREGTGGQAGNAVWAGVQRHPGTAAAEIIADIESGALAPGRRVPTESNLMQRYGVARDTARRVMRYLREEGYVRTVPQRGSYVIDQSESQSDA
ncbi:winged helix-turn-helix domain-containing protein [Streptomyces sp. NPDC090442]|uniref:winged helix-turn-helix domain-containing protein n=1 Tax=Streptomyces sp. NPDC090442 TaxID=3365962 RepID=UPI0037F20754